MHWNCFNGAVKNIFESTGTNAGKKCQRVSLTNLHSNMDIRWCLTKITLARFPLNALMCMFSAKKTFYIPLSQKKDWPYSNKVGTAVTLGPSTAFLPMNAIQKRTTLSK